MHTPGDPWIPLHTDAFRVAINPFGAELAELRDAAGRDLLWNGDPAFWSGRAPILFPIVGALAGGQYRWRGRSCALPRHGFARRRAFHVVSDGGQSVRLRQSADADTRAVYPFDFQLDVVFALAGSVLDIEATVTNTGSETLPASLGFHPAFRWPLPCGGPRDTHGITFEQEEPAPVRRLDADGLLRPDGEPTPVRARHLALHDDLFDDDVLILEQPRSRSLVYGGATGPRLRLSFGPVSHLGLWSRPGAGFVCVEPWRGVADPAGFAGDFATKPGVFHVPPGASESLSLRIEQV